MEFNEIRITLHGLPGSGKSTVAQFILQALIKAGFNNVNFDDPGLTPRTPLTDRVAEVRHKVEINIETHEWHNISQEYLLELQAQGLTGDDCK